MITDVSLEPVQLSARPWSPPVLEDLGGIDSVEAMSGVGADGGAMPDTLS